MKKISKNFLSKFALVVAFLMFFTTQVVRATEIIVDSTIDNEYVFIVDGIRGTTPMVVEDMTYYVVPGYDYELTIDEILNSNPTTTISSETTVVVPDFDLGVVQVSEDYESEVTVEEISTVTTNSTTVTESVNTFADIDASYNSEVIEVITMPENPVIESGIIFTILVVQLWIFIFGIMWIIFYFT